MDPKTLAQLMLFTLAGISLSVIWYSTRRTYTVHLIGEAEVIVIYAHTKDGAKRKAKRIQQRGGYSGFKLRRLY